MYLTLDYLPCCSCLICFGEGYEWRQMYWRTPVRHNVLSRTRKVLLKWKCLWSVPCSWKVYSKCNVVKCFFSIVLFSKPEFINMWITTDNWETMSVVHKLKTLLTWSKLDQVSTLLSECPLFLSLFCSYVKRLIGYSRCQAETFQTLYYIYINVSIHDVVNENRCFYIYFWSKGPMSSFLEDLTWVGIGPLFQIKLKLNIFLSNILLYKENGEFILMLH
jgi:hypothetical protein